MKIIHFYMRTTMDFLQIDEVYMEIICRQVLPMYS